MMGGETLGRFYLEETSMGVELHHGRPPANQNDIPCAPYDCFMESNHIRQDVSKSAGHGWPGSPKRIVYII